MKNIFNNVVYLFSFFRKDNINEYFYRITHPHVHMSMFTTHDNNATMPFTTSQNKHWSREYRYIYSHWPFHENMKTFQKIVSNVLRTCDSVESISL